MAGNNELETAQEILNYAKTYKVQANDHELTEKALKDNNYNTSYYLSGEEIHFIALMLMSNSLSKAPEVVASTYPIYTDFNIDEAKQSGPIDYTSLFINHWEDQINIAKKYVTENNTPSFFVLKEFSHFVTLAFVPNDNAEGHSLIYINSINEKGGLGNAGLEFAGKLATYLNITLTNLSYSHQYDGCCGLSAALNIAKIAGHFNQSGNIESLKTEFDAFGKNSLDIQELYSTLGMIMVKTINSDYLPLDEVVNFSMYTGNHNVEIVNAVFAKYYKYTKYSNNLAVGGAPDPSPSTTLKNKIEIVKQIIDAFISNDKEMVKHVCSIFNISTLKDTRDYLKRKNPSKEQIELFESMLGNINISSDGMVSWKAFDPDLVDLAALGNVVFT